MYVEELKIWQDASSHCTKKGGNLASIHDQEENDFIFSEFLLTFYI